MYQDYKDQGVMFFTVMTEDEGGQTPDLSDVQRWADKYSLTYPILIAADRIGIKYGIPGYPTNYIMDQSMIIRYKQGGFNENAMRNMIENLLNNPPGSPTPAPSATPFVPTPTPAPTEPPVPTATPMPGQINLQLELPQAYFQQGDLFYLLAHLDNPNSFQMDIDYYCVLDVFGAYYFYPNWGRDLTYKAMTLDPGMRSETVIAGFYWPKVDGQVDGIAFVSVATDPGTYDLASNVSSTSFGYGP